MILVTGGSGQLAQALVAHAGARPVRVVGRPEFDFDAPDAMVQTIAAARPSLVVNAAAYTAVDRAESDPEAAARANEVGPGLIARYCAQAGIPLIHVSTDYVFDGLKGSPYTEDDDTSPTGVYGSTKLAGEHAVAAAGGRAIVLRTSWVYAPRGKNFVLTMLNAATRTDTLRVVADQIGCPTSAPDLARAIHRIADRVAEGWDASFGGVFHACGTGETSWHGLAVATFEQAARHGRTMPTVHPIATADWPTPARRPPDSRLDASKLDRVFGIGLPDWRVSLAATVDEALGKAGQG